MSVIKEWECKVHGRFDGSHPICEAGGCDSSQVERIFLTPPGIRTLRTRTIDRHLNDVAKDYNLTDMSNKNGESVMQNKINATQNPFAPAWGAPGAADNKRSLEAMVAGGRRSVMGEETQGLKAAHSTLPKLVNGRPPTRIIARDKGNPA